MKRFSPSRRLDAIGGDPRRQSVPALRRCCAGTAAQPFAPNLPPAAGACPCGGIPRPY